MCAFFFGFENGDQWSSGVDSFGLGGKFGLGMGKRQGGWDCGDCLVEWKCLFIILFYYISPFPLWLLLCSFVVARKGDELSLR